jgi:pilus assembly protein FimV
LAKVSDDTWENDDVAWDASEDEAAWDETLDAEPAPAVGDILSRIAEMANRVEPPVAPELSDDSDMIAALMDDATDNDMSMDEADQDDATADDIALMDDEETDDLADLAIMDGLAADQDVDEADELSDLAALDGLADEATLANLSALDADETMDVDGTDEDEPRRSGQAMLPATPDEDEAALSRILSETDAQMNDPDSRTRRAAIAQLKAAVAATEAARLLGEDQDDDGEDVENAFRDDLKQAVRPRRPMAMGDQRADQRTDRPRPAPLKLVASQRIDLPVPVAATSAIPVRPRRVMVQADAGPATAQVSESGSFAAFAEDMGARNLGDLLEAAAAYTAFVEGIEDFSRPQLMKKLSAVAPDQFNREDTLRSFGTLLREGRITRAPVAGRFQVSEETRFHPDRRAS